MHYSGGSTHLQMQEGESCSGASMKKLKGSKGSRLIKMKDKRYLKRFANGLMMRKIDSILRSHSWKFVRTRSIHLT